MIVSGMTVAIGVIDEAGALLIATDSRMADEQAMTLHDGVLKSIRVNHDCALTFSGDGRWANRLVADLFRWSDVTIPDENEAIAYVEASQLALPDVPFIVAYKVGAILGQYREDVQAGTIPLPAINVMLAQIDRGHKSISAWTASSHWCVKGLVQVPGNVVYQLFGPGEPPEAKTAMEDATVGVADRILRVAKAYREICPCGVNLDISVRCARDGFLLHPLSFLMPSNSPAPGQ